jgi:hypothetical protein
MRSKILAPPRSGGVGFSQAPFLVLYLSVTKLPLSESVPYFDSKFVGAGRRINPSPIGADTGIRWSRVSRVSAHNRVEAMSPQNPLPNFDDPKLLTALAQAFESAWLVMRAHEPLLDAARANELGIEISRKLVELAADGVTDPAQLRRLTLESLPLSPAH